MALNPALIRDSFEALKPKAQEFVARFYEILFERHPRTKALFASSDMGSQHQKLVYALAAAVGNLEDPDKLRKLLLPLGRKHREYGVSPADFDLVAEALILTFREFFGENWTPALEESWVAVYQAVAGMMLESYTAPLTVQETLRSTVDRLAREMLRTAVTQAVDGELASIARAKARELLLAALEAEANALRDERSAA